MARIRTQPLILTASLTVLLAACGGEAGSGGDTAAAGDAPPEIAERQDNFEAIGDAFKAIRTQLEGDSPDMSVIEASASDINERAGKITELFPEGTSVDDGFDTEALATIWEKPDDFAQAAKNLVDASAVLRNIAAEGGDAAAIGEAVKNMGGTCKACHDDFRVDDDA